MNDTDTPRSEYLGPFRFRCTDCGKVHFMEREAIRCCPIRTDEDRDCDCRDISQHACNVRDRWGVFRIRRVHNNGTRATVESYLSQGFIAFSVPLSHLENVRHVERWADK